jgi:hypothetical protein
MMLAILATPDTPCHASGPALLFEIFEAGFIIRELLVEVFQGEAQVLGDVLFDFHDANSIPNSLLDVKGYLPVASSERAH